MEYDVFEGKVHNPIERSITMGGRGNAAARNTDNRSVEQLYNDYHISSENSVREAFRNGSITQEQRDKALHSMYEGAEKIVNKMIDNFTEQTEKALVSTMDRKFALTSDSDITGALQFYKTANGFVIEAPSTRSSFRAFMDNQGVVRRLPNNEMTTARKISLTGQTVRGIADRFSEISRRRMK